MTVPAEVAYTRMDPNKKVSMWESLSFAIGSSRKETEKGIAYSLMIPELFVDLSFANKYPQGTVTFSPSQYPVDVEVVCHRRFGDSATITVEVRSAGRSESFTFPYVVGSPIDVYKAQADVEMFVAGYWRNDYVICPVVSVVASVVASYNYELREESSK